MEERGDFRVFQPQVNDIGRKNARPAFCDEALNMRLAFVLLKRGSVPVNLVDDPLHGCLRHHVNYIHKGIRFGTPDTFGSFFREPVKFRRFIVGKRKYCEPAIRPWRTGLSRGRWRGIREFSAIQVNARRIGETPVLPIIGTGIFPARASSARARITGVTIPGTFVAATVVASGAVECGTVVTGIFVAAAVPVAPLATALPLLRCLALALVGEAAVRVSVAAVTGIAVVAVPPTMARVAVALITAILITAILATEILDTAARGAVVLAAVAVVTVGCAGSVPLRVVTAAGTASLARWPAAVVRPVAIPAIAGVAGCPAFRKAVGPVIVASPHTPHIRSAPLSVNR
ncbi:MAG TPA: hypothetical protein VK817_22810 [Trebonia sp.]|nr:hypothetical protein [Trebonia sp.]